MSDDGETTFTLSHLPHSSCEERGEDEEAGSHWSLFFYDMALTFDVTCTLNQQGQEESERERQQQKEGGGMVAGDSSSA